MTDQEKYRHYLRRILPIKKAFRFCDAAIEEIHNAADMELWLKAFARSNEIQENLTPAKARERAEKNMCALGWLGYPTEIAGRMSGWVRECREARAA